MSSKRFFNEIQLRFMQCKSILLSLLVIFTSCMSYAQQPKHQLSSHILDISKGMPATDVKISLQKQLQDNQWELVSEKITDENGRVPNFLPQVKDGDNIGVYKLTFFVEPYFQSQQLDTFYPFIEVVFEIKDDKHYHVPITLSAFGYGTYRGN